MTRGGCLGTAAAAGTFSFLVFVFSALLRAGPRVSPHPASSPASPDEKTLFDSANRERAAAKLHLLHWDEALATAARQHAELMVREVLLSHQYPDEASLVERASRAGAKFFIVAENIALGPDAESIHRGWMRSPPHRKNILNPALTAVGIAVIKGTAGLYAAQDFSAQVRDLSLEQQEEQVVSLLAASGVRGARVTKDARATCKGRTYASVRDLYIFRFEATDLSELPNELVGKIKSERYGRAGVGACSDHDSGGFTRYRLAVLLY